MVKSVPSASIVWSGSLDLIVCSKPSRPYRSAGLNRTCCAGVCGTPPVVTLDVGGGNACVAAPPAPAAAAAARSAAAWAELAELVLGEECKVCRGSEALGALALGGSGDEVLLAALGEPFRRLAG